MLFARIQRSFAWVLLLVAATALIAPIAHSVQVIVPPPTATSIADGRPSDAHSAPASKPPPPS